jgi:hypothetical protein
MAWDGKTCGLLEHYRKNEKILEEIRAKKVGMEATTTTTPTAPAPLVTASVTENKRFFQPPTFKGLNIHVGSCWQSPNRSMDHQDEMKFLSGVFHAPSDDTDNNADRNICHTEHTRYTYLYLFRKNYTPYQKPA